MGLFDDFRSDRENVHVASEEMEGVGTWSKRILGEADQLQRQVAIRKASGSATATGTRAGMAPFGSSVPPIEPRTAPPSNMTYVNRKSSQQRKDADQALRRMRLRLDLEDFGIPIVMGAIGIAGIFGFFWVLSVVVGPLFSAPAQPAAPVHQQMRSPAPVCTCQE